MWPTNTNAKTYLSRKINGKGRPWTDSDNEKAKQAIHELGLQLIKDTPQTKEQKAIPEPVKIESSPTVKKDKPVKREADKEPTKAELLREMLKNK